MIYFGFNAVEAFMYYVSTQYLVILFMIVVRHMNSNCNTGMFN